MKHLNKSILDTVEIKWVEQGESLPLMQGMALNKLNKEYPSKMRCGWMLWNDRFNWGNQEEILPEACYYLLERNIELEGTTEKRVVAFKENGDSLEGYALFI
jgi:hypothetical protein